jgi:hypothetical protein
MTFKLTVSLAALAVATTLLTGPSQAASPALVGAAPDQTAVETPVGAADFTKYSDKEKVVDAPLDLSAIEPDRIQYVRNLASGRLPEPGAWALMLIGFGGAGHLLRRSRRRARAASI